MQFTVGIRNDGFLESNPDDDAGCLSHLPRRGIADNMWLAIPSVATTVRVGTPHRIIAYHIKTHTVPKARAKQRCAKPKATSTASDEAVNANK